MPAWHPRSLLLLMLLTTLHFLLMTSSPLLHDSAADNRFSKQQHDVIDLALLSAENRRQLERKPRIVGGQNASEQANPWMAQIIAPKAKRPNFNETPTPASYEFECGGSIISPRYILTAAHCLTDPRHKDANNVFRPLPPRDVTVVTGQTQKATNETAGQHRVEEIFIHEKYDMTLRGSAYDIALVKLSHPLELLSQGRRSVDGRSMSMSSIALPRQEGLTPEELGSMHCKAAGWGKVDQTRNYTIPEIDDYLREVNLTVASREECLQWLEWFVPKVFARSNLTGSDFIETCLCVGAANISEGGKSPCSGDSGGPLVCRRSPHDEWFQVGIVSFGYTPACGKPDTYTVFTDVSKYQEWIHNVIGPTTTSVDVDYAVITATVGGVAAFITVVVVLVAGYSWRRRQ